MTSRRNLGRNPTTSTPRSGELSIGNLIGLVSDSIRRSSKRREAEHAPAVKTRTAVRMLLSKIMRYTLIGLFVVLLFLAFVAYIASLPVGRPVQKPQANLSLGVEVIDYGVLSYEKAESATAYSTVALEVSGADNVSISYSAFSKPIPSTVLLLKSRRDQAAAFGEFRQRLAGQLADRGIRLGEIHVDQLSKLPPGASAIIVAPTGRVPASFLGLVEKDFNFTRLLANGNVIIYMGYEFGSGAIPENSTSSIMPVSQELVNSFRLLFKGVPKKEPGYKIENPAYAVTGQGGRTISGVLSAVDFGATGALVFIPQVMDLGWLSGSDAADDVLRAIETVAWQTPIAQQAQVIMTDRGGLNETRTIFSGGYVRAPANALMRFTAEKGNMTERLMLFQSLPLSVSGVSVHQGSVLPSPVTEKDLPIVIEFRLKESPQRSAPMRLLAYRDGELASQAEVGTLSTSGQTSVGYYVNIPGGDYVLRLADAQGRVYSQSYLHVIRVNFTIRPNWASGAFLLEPLFDGQKSEVGIYNVTVSLDGNQPQTLYAQKSQIVYTFKGQIAEGNHALFIDVGADRLEIPENYVRRREFWDNPLYQAAFLIAAIIFFVGYTLKKPDKVLLSIDVPDFPPLSRIKVSIDKERVIEIFDKVNEDYRWRFMPLRHVEIKNGFRRMSYGGRPILIGDYNLEKLLDRLVHEGLVFKQGEFYGPVSWERASGKSAMFLTSFRRMRDIFINRAVNFAEMGEMPDCDTRVAGAEPLYVHIYTGLETARRALITAPKGKTAIVFETSHEIDSFENSLRSTSGHLIALKLEIERGGVRLLTLEELQAAIR
ncbi:MAG: hypothetical protein NT157_02260 [Candidatus Micrarchaeota archaeon]|nr:hypothetical protein [Candidatus Micrarchaeota archaeon]